MTCIHCGTYGITSLRACPHCGAWWCPKCGEKNGGDKPVFPEAGR